MAPATEVSTHSVGVGVGVQGINAAAPTMTHKVGLGVSDTVGVQLSNCPVSEFISPQRVGVAEGSSVGVGVQWMTAKA